MGMERKRAVRMGRDESSIGSGEEREGYIILYGGLVGGDTEGCTEV